MQILMVASIVVSVALNGVLMFLLWTSKSFFKEYGGEKGRHLATMEGLEEALKKVQLETMTTKEAEIMGIQNKLDLVVEQNDRIVKSSEQIKDSVSNRRRIWELKREAAYDVMKICGTLSHTFAVLESAWGAARKTPESNPHYVKMLEEVLKLQDRFTTTIESLWQLEGIMTLWFGESILQHLRGISGTSSELLSALNTSTNEDVKIKLQAFMAMRLKITILLQEELQKEQ